MTVVLTQKARTELRQEEAREMVKRSYDEMMRKYELIPTASPYRKTFLEIRLHKEISQALAKA